MDGSLGKGLSVHVEDKKELLKKGNFQEACSNTRGTLVQWVKNHRNLNFENERHLNKQGRDGFSFMKFNFVECLMFNELHYLRK